LLVAQSNASLDGILVAAQDSKIVFHNHRLLELWQLPGDAFAGSLQDAVTAMKGRTDGRQNPLGETDVANLNGESDAPSTLVLADGRTLDCYGAPVLGKEGQFYGTVWYFRDITERKRLGRQILEAGELERQRIGQDLHDDLCQHLTGITFLGRVLQQRLAAKLPSEVASAAQIVELVEQAVKRARDLARGLLPLQLEHAGLDGSLHDLAASVQTMFGIQCHFHCEQAVSMDDPASQIQLYRITQEAITNAVRHGRARTIYIDLAQVDGRLILTVEDDGVGIRDTPAGRGLGLRTMRHRARMIGASLKIERADTTGTIVTCMVGPHAGTQEQHHG
jgi:signal transduction histidine kinase